MKADLYRGAGRVGGAATIAVFHLRCLAVPMDPLLVSGTWTIFMERPDLVRYVTLAFFDALPRVAKFRLLTSGTHRHVARFGGRVSLLATCKWGVGPMNEFKVVDNHVHYGANCPYLSPCGFPIGRWVMRRVFTEFGDFVKYFALNLDERETARPCRRRGPYWVCPFAGYNSYCFCLSFSYLRLIFTFWIRPTSIYLVRRPLRPGSIRPPG